MAKGKHKRSKLKLTLAKQAESQAPLNVTAPATITPAWKWITLGNVMVALSTLIILALVFTFEHYNSTNDGEHWPWGSIVDTPGFDYHISQFYVPK